MGDKTRRKELLAQYKETQPEAGIYRIVNGKNGKAYLDSTPNLANIRGQMEFAKSTKNMLSILNQRLRNDIREFGIDAFSLEILEVLEITPGMTGEEIRRDLATLEELWREKFDPALLY